MDLSCGKVVLMLGQKSPKNQPVAARPRLADLDPENGRPAADSHRILENYSRQMHCFDNDGFAAILPRRLFRRYQNETS